MKNFFLFFLLSLVFGINSCKDNNDSSSDESLTVTLYNSVEESNIIFPEQDSIALKGLVKSPSNLTRLLYYSVETSGTEVLIGEEPVQNLTEFSFSKKVYVSPYYSAIRVKAYDVMNRAVKVDFSLKVTKSNWTNSLDKFFPGAQGGGSSATGGRFGKVYYVTTTMDNTAPGSLRWAINQTGPRIIVFKVSGNIYLGTALEISNGDVTIAGQTAPGDGICLRDYPVRIKANNVIVQFLRFRMGDLTKTQDDALGCIGYENIMIDHCSMSWSTDECGSFYKNKNFTLQWSILSESLTNSVHEKGAHGYGGIWGGQNASFHHNLLADHDSRNPRFDHDGISGIRGPIDFVNNVIYNWGGNSSYGGENRQINIVNNYYKAGLATSAKNRIFNPSGTTVASGSSYLNPYGRYYIEGNYVYGYPDATADNWGVGVQMPNLTSSAATADKATFKQMTPFAVTEINKQSAEDAYVSVLEKAGASLKRDLVDSRIVNDVRNISYVYEGTNGSTGGLIDSQQDVKGWPALSSVSAPTDSDGDGMPDTWEETNGLNKYNASDRNFNTLNAKQTNIEVYLNGLVSNLY